MHHAFVLQTADTMNERSIRRGAVSTRRSYTKTATIHTRLDEDLFLKLQMRSNKDRRSPSEINRRALEAYLLADV